MLNKFIKFLHDLAFYLIVRPIILHILDKIKQEIQHNETKN